MADGPRPAEAAPVPHLDRGQHTRPDQAGRDRSGPAVERPVGLSERQAKRLRAMEAEARKLEKKRHDYLDERVGVVAVDTQGNPVQLGERDTRLMHQFQEAIAQTLPTRKYESRRFKERLRSQNQIVVEVDTRRGTTTFCSIRGEGLARVEGGQFYLQTERPSDPLWMQALAGQYSGVMISGYQDKEGPSVQVSAVRISRPKGGQEAIEVFSADESGRMTASKRAPVAEGTDYFRGLVSAPARFRNEEVLGTVIRILDIGSRSKPDQARILRKIAELADHDGLTPELFLGGAGARFLKAAGGREGILRSGQVTRAEQIHTEAELANQRNERVDVVVAHVGAFRQLPLDEQRLLVATASSAAHPDRLRLNIIAQGSQDATAADNPILIGEEVFSMRAAEQLVRTHRILGTEMPQEERSTISSAPELVMSMLRGQAGFTQQDSRTAMERANALVEAIEERVGDQYQDGAGRTRQEITLEVISGMREFDNISGASETASREVSMRRLAESIGGRSDGEMLRYLLELRDYIRVIAEQNDGRVDDWERFRTDVIRQIASMKGNVGVEVATDAFDTIIGEQPIEQVSIADATVTFLSAIRQVNSGQMQFEELLSMRDDPRYLSAQVEIDSLMDEHLRNQDSDSVAVELLRQLSGIQRGPNSLAIALSRIHSATDSGRLPQELGDVLTGVAEALHGPNPDQEAVQLAQRMIDAAVGVQGAGALRIRPGGTSAGNQTSS